MDNRTCIAGHFYTGKVCPHCGALTPIQVNDALGPYGIEKVLQKTQSDNCYRVRYGEERYQLWEYHDHLKVPVREAVLAELEQAQLPLIDWPLQHFTEVLELENKRVPVLYSLHDSRLLNATNLHDYMARHGFMPAEQLIQVMEQLLEALAHAESARWVYNGLSSQYLKILDDHRICLDPFFYAHPFRFKVLSPRVILGFHPPEQIRTGVVYKESDRYALAMLFFHLCTGLSPVLWYPDTPLLSMYSYFLGRAIPSFFHLLLQPVDAVPLSKLRSNWAKVKPELEARLSDRFQDEVKTFYRGYHYFQIKKRDRAADILLPLLEGKLNNPHVPRILAEIFSQDNMHRDAALLFGESIRREKLGCTYMKAAEFYIREHKFERAQRAAIKATKRTPYVPEPYILTARCFKELNRYKTALMWLERAQEIKPTRDAAELIQRISTSLFPLGKETRTTTDSATLRYDRTEIVPWQETDKILSQVNAKAIERGETLGKYQVVEVLQRRMHDGVNKASSYIVQNQRGEKLWMKEVLNNFSGRKRFNKEVLILEQLDHPGIPRLQHHYQEEAYSYIVQDFVEAQDLAHFVKSGYFFSEAEVRCIFEQVLDAICHLQEKQIIHCDIKPKNILWNPQTKRATLIDFDVSTDAKLPRKVLRASGITPEFAPPEQRHTREANYTTDVYALALTCLYLMTGLIPEIFFHFHQHKYDYYQEFCEISPAFRKLLEKILTAKISRRHELYRSALEISNHYRLQVQSHPPAPVQDAKETLKQAVYQLKQSESLEELIENGAALEKLHPSATVLFVIGDRLGRKEDYNRAIRYLQNAAQRNPKWQLPYYKIAEIYMRQKNYFKAVKTAEQILDVCPGEPHAYKLIARSYAHDNKFNEALDYFRKYLYLVPGDTNAMLDMAQIHLLLNQLDACRRLCKEALYQNLLLARAYEYLQTVAAAYGEFEKAREYGLRAIGIAPENSRLRYDFGLTLYQLGEYDKAIESLHEALRLEPDFLDTHYFLGHCHLKRNELEKALEHFQMALQTGKQTERLQQTIQIISDRIQNPDTRTAS